MKQKLEKTIKTLIRLEDTRASQGVFARSDESVEKQIHEAQVKTWDTRRALALSSVHRSEAPLSYVRSLLQRGNLENARKIIEDLRNAESQGPLEKAQILFEQARLEFFESNWKSVIQTVHLALTEGAPTVTQLALFQLRANAYFEIGDFRNCSSDIEEAENLGILFPHAVSLLYIRTLKVRLRARDRGVEFAHTLLDQTLTEKIASSQVNLDLLLTFLRVQIDLKRLALLPSISESRMCFMISDAIGDKLYCALAELDYFLNFSTSIQEFSLLTRPLSGRFCRTDILLREIETGYGEISITGQTLRDTLGRLQPWENTEKSTSPGPLEEDSFKNTVVILERFGIVSDLEHSKVVCLKKDNQILQALLSLSRGKMSKKIFFSRLWGRQLYAARLHDTLISSLFHRIKKETGIIIQIRDGEIEALKHIVVL